MKKLTKKDKKAIKTFGLQKPISEKPGDNFCLCFTGVWIPNDNYPAIKEDMRLM